MGYPHAGEPSAQLSGGASASRYGSVGLCGRMQHQSIHSHQYFDHAVQSCLLTMAHNPPKRKTQATPFLP